MIECAQPEKSRLPKLPLPHIFLAGKFWRVIGFSLDVAGSRQNLHFSPLGLKAIHDKANRKMLS